MGAIAILLLALLVYILVGAVFIWAFQPGVKGDRQALDAIPLRAPANAPPKGPDRAYSVDSGRESFARRVELVQSAQKTLNLAVYTIKPGISSQLFFATLLQAADRGVQVRILLSGKTNRLKRYPDLYAALRGHQNITLRQHNPLNPLAPWGWNVLMHDKIILADGHTFTLGGRNYGDEYCHPPGYGGALTHDREVFVCGGGEISVLPQVKDYYEQLWNHRATKPLKRAGGIVADTARESLLALLQEWRQSAPDYFAVDAPLEKALLPTKRITLLHNPLTIGVKRPWLGYQLNRLAATGADILVQTPYMTDNPRFFTALAAAAQRGRLRVLTNSCRSSPNLPAYSIYLAKRQSFLATGAQLWEYGGEKSSIHGKSMMVDGQVCAIGSFNLDDRSLHIDTETMLVIEGEAFCTAFQRDLDALLDQSVQVDEKTNAYVPGGEWANASAEKQTLMRRAYYIFRLVRFLV